MKAVLGFMFTFMVISTVKKKFVQKYNIKKIVNKTSHGKNTNS